MYGTAYRSRPDVSREVSLGAKFECRFLLLVVLSMSCRDRSLECCLRVSDETLSPRNCPVVPSCSILVWYPCRSWRLMRSLRVLQAVRGLKRHDPCHHRAMDRVCGPPLLRNPELRQLGCTPPPVTNPPGSSSRASLCLHGSSTAKGR